MNIIWIIAIAAYLGVSIYYGLKPTSGKFFDLLSTSIKNKDGRVTLLSLIRYIFTVVILIIGFFLFLPAGVIHTLQSKFISWKIDREIEKRERTGYQYHESLSGCGTLICKDCGHQEEIVSFTHWIGEKRGCKTGYQCKKCGKHVALYSDKETKPNLTCDCGGSLNREKALFCSKCKSKNLEYKLTAIT